MARQPTGRPNGRPPKPVALKRRNGNPGKRALPPPPTSAPRAAEPGEQPLPPRPLGAHGADVWARVWPATEWLTAADVELVLMLCEAADERGLLRHRTLRDGGWRDRSALRQLDRQIAACLSMLGLTPSDRARVGLSDAQPPDELAQLRARHGPASVVTLGGAP